MHRTIFAACVVACGLVTYAKAAPPPTGVPQFDAALQKGIGWLSNKLGTERSYVGGYRSLCAYALLMAGEPANSPAILGAVDEVRKRSTTAGYKPASQEHHIYEAGVDCMLLVQAGANQYRNEIDVIAKYIVAQQGADGSWDYPMRTVGDTSMAQYAVLGLWAAARSGIDVPLEAWDKAAAWHIKTQRPDGGFMYHPGVSVSEGTGGANPTLNMTAGAAGSLGIAKLHLYPESLNAARKKEKIYGVLEERKAEPDKPVYKPQIPLSQLDNSIQKALGWLTARYLPISDLPHKNYYNFALERACSANFLTTLGGKIDWFRSAGDELVKLQKPDGSWDDYSGPHVGTSFAILFFIRPTKKVIAEQLGGGLLTGGRGLPDDLAKADVRKGKVQERKSQGGLDDLLTELASQDAAILDDAQTEFVEKVQIGNREELLGQLDTIRKLAKHPNPEIRRTAIWALGRSGKISDAMMLIQALNDNDVDVLVEANAALRYLSRKLSGVGIPESPFQDLPENATDAQKIAAVAAWRAEALKRWTNWYTRVRPFHERNDLFELLNQTAK